jgi:hypothetical protein
LIRYRIQVVKEKDFKEKDETWIAVEKKKKKRLSRLA